MKLLNSRAEALRRQFDVIVDPIIPGPLERLALSLQAQENYGARMKKIDEYLLKAKEQGLFKRKVFLQVFDTGAKSRSKYLQKNFKDIGRDHTTDGNAFDEHFHFSHVLSSMIGSHPSGRMGILDSPHIPEGFFEAAGEKILNRQGGGQYPWIVAGLKAGMEKAKPYLDKGYAVVWNNSWGAVNGFSDEIAKLFEQARNMGIFVFASAGNSGGQHNVFPAMLPTVFSVAAIDEALNRASFSTISANNDLSGAGVNIWGADHTESGTRYASGTSMASPNAAAATAAFLMCNPGVTPQSLMGVLEKHCTDLPPVGLDANTGFGVPILTRFPYGETAPPPPPPPQDPTKRPSPALVQPVLNTEYDQTVYFGNNTAPQTIKCQVGLSLTAISRTDIEVKKLQENLSAYFSRRGYVVPEKWDAHEVAWTIGRFLEIIFPKQYGQQISVDWVEIEHNGQRIYREYDYGQGPNKATANTFYVDDTSKMTSLV